VGALIDTALFVHAERSHTPLNQLLMAVGVSPSEPVAMAAMTFAELLVGVERADPSHRAERAEFVGGLLAVVPVLPFGRDEAATYASLVWLLRGQEIGVADVQIAATAVTHAYAVVTFNQRHFERVPGLRVLVPSV